MDVFTKIKEKLVIYKFQRNAVLKDGTELVIDGDLSVGVEVFVVTSDGNKPIPDGEYELEIGYLITVQDGKIDTIKEPINEEEVIAEVPSEETTEETTEPVEVVPVEEQIAELDIRVKALEEALANLMSSQKELSEENKTLKKEKEEFLKQVKDFEEKLSKMDGAVPLNKRKAEVVEKSPIELFKTTANRIKNLGIKL